MVTTICSSWMRSSIWISVSFSTISVRRGSEYFSLISSSSFTTTSKSRSSVERMAESAAIWSQSAAYSPASFSCSRPVRRESRISRIARA